MFSSDTLFNQNGVTQDFISQNFFNLSAQLTLKLLYTPLSYLSTTPQNIQPLQLVRSRQTIKLIYRTYMKAFWSILVYQCMCVQDPNHFSTCFSFQRSCAVICRLGERCVVVLLQSVRNTRLACVFTMNYSTILLRFLVLQTYQQTYTQEL